MPQGKEKAISQRKSSSNAVAKHKQHAVCRQPSPSYIDQSLNPPRGPVNVNGMSTEEIKSQPPMAIFRK